jgi:O-antigen/teichoic acid export membrane protein
VEKLPRMDIRGSGGTAGRGAVALCDQCVVSGASFLTTVAVGRFAGVDELGLYALGFAVLVMAAAAHEALLWTPLAVFANRRDEDRRAGFGDGLLLQALAAAVGLTALALTAGAASWGLTSAETAAVLWALAAALPAYLFRELARRVLLAELRVVAVTVFDVSVAALQIGALVALHWAGRLSAASALLMLGAAGVLPSAVWFLRSRRQFDVAWPRLVPAARRYWAFGKWLCAGQVTAVARNYSIHYLLAVMLGAAATGVYAACSSVVMFANPLVLGLGSLLVPKAAQVLADEGHSGVRRVVRKTTWLLGAAMAAMCLAIILTGDLAVRLLYGGEAAGADGSGCGAVLAVLALATLAATLGCGANNGLWAIERPDVSFRAGLAGLVVTLPAAMLLGWWFGVVGAALGSAAGMAVTSAWQMIGFDRLSRPLAPVVTAAVATAGEVVP